MFTNFINRSISVAEISTTTSAIHSVVSYSGSFVSFAQKYFQHITFFCIFRQISTFLYHHILTFEFLELY